LQAYQPVEWMTIILRHIDDELQVAVSRPAGYKHQPVEWMTIILRHIDDELQVAVSRPDGYKHQPVEWMIIISRHIDDELQVHGIDSKRNKLDTIIKAD
jgi:hypothetical protein